MSEVTQMRAAGWCPPETDDSVGKALESLAERPPTPEHLRPYRREHQKPLGTQAIHHGRFRDPSVAADVIHGVRSGQEEDTKALLQPPDETHLKSFMRGMQETIYRRTEIGRSVTHGNKPPRVAESDPNFLYGVANETHASVSTVLGALKPEEQLDDGDAGRALYRRSHGHRDPGEPLGRDYEWPSHIDPAEHSFGASDGKPIEGHGSLMCIQPGPRTKEAHVSPIVHKHARVLTDRLHAEPGVVVDRNTRPDHYDPDIVHGVRGVEGESAAGCFTMCKEFAPEVSLGAPKGSKPEDKHVFGVPSIRHDLAVPVRRSVSDFTAYPDDADIATSIAPGITEKGVGTFELLTALPKDDLHDLLKNSGFDMSQFDSIYSLADELSPDAVSPKLFLEVYRRS